MSAVTLTVVKMDRTCKGCSVSKPIADFYFYAHNRPSWKCKDCHVVAQRKAHKARWDSDPEYRERHNEYGKAVRRGEIPKKKCPSIPGNEKQCKVCGIVKSMSEFPKRGEHRLNSCHPCYKEFENRKARQRSREDEEYRVKKTFTANRARWIKRYGVTVQQVIRALESQHGLCANRACGVEISLTAPKEQSKRAVIDHCHKTGRFRGLLCDHCNILLGHIEIGPNRVLGLIEYAEKHSTLERCETP